MQRVYTLKILLLDIETAPNVAYVWRLYDQNIATNQLVANSHILCWSAKWLGEKEMFYNSLFEATEAKMVKEIHTLIDEADVVVHYNGTKFDMPTLQREFLTNGLSPASPVKQVDLLPIVRRQFKFSSNKLDFVCQMLGLGNKVHHKGMDLWRDCMAREPKAWAVMKRYNKQDVLLLEKLYLRILPWIPAHPNHNQHEATLCCPRCASTKFQKRGVQRTSTLTYTRYQCSGCGGWFKGPKVPEQRKVGFTPIT